MSIWENINSSWYVIIIIMVRRESEIRKIGRIDGKREK